MAVNNRTEAESAINAAIVPTVTNTIHKNLLNDELISSFNFRKDVIDSETPSVGAVTVDFSDKDLATIVAGGNLTVSFSNLVNGDDSKFIYITKSASDVIQFSGATDVSKNKKYINSVATTLVYEVFQKNGSIYVRNLNINQDLVETGDLAYTNNNLNSPTNITSKYCRSGNIVNWSFKFDEGAGDISADTLLITINNSDFHPLQNIYGYMSREDQADGIPIHLDTSGQLRNRNTLPQSETYEFTLTYMV